MKDERSIQPLLAALRADDGALLAYLDGLESCFEAREAQVMAFVAEEGRFARLRREAVALLQDYPDPAGRPPLFGLPIGVKDIFHVDGFVTRAGSHLPPEQLQGNEAACVAALRRAGALVVGKTATTEFAYFAPGPTRNPRNLAHTPGGSSSGSAAAVAAGLVPFALGTQTIGSINRPAAFCGVVGYKPSHGRIPTDGILPLSPTYDHVGYFTADVAGAEHMAAHVCADWHKPEPMTQRPVLAIPSTSYLAHADPGGLAHFHHDCHRLLEAGFAIKTLDALPDFDEIRRQHVLLVAAEAARVHAAWFERYELRYHPKTADLIRAGQQVRDEAIADAHAYSLGVRQRLMAMLDAYGIDAWLTPSARGPAPRGLDSTGDPIMNLPWTHAGLPTLTIPTGADASGLPMALQLVGRWQEDERLFSVGQWVSETVGQYGLAAVGGRPSAVEME